MKKLLIIALSISMFVSCKKGENDPGISLRSRDARIVGEWTIESFENTNIETIGSTKTTIVQKYNGSTITLTNNGGTPAPSTSTYKGKLDIKKDGTYTYTETRTTGSNSTTETQTGNWSWLNSKKNKTQILISANGNLLQGNGIYIVDELRNKKLVLKESSYEKTQTSTSTSEDSNNYTVTLVQ